MSRPVSSQNKNSLSFYFWGAYISPLYTQRSFNELKTDSEKIKELCSGENHLFIKKEKTIYGFGDNSFQQISPGKSNDFYSPFQITLLSDKQIQKIVCGCDFTFLITDENQIYSFGQNAMGQLGQGHNNNVSTPTIIKNFSVFGKLKNDSSQKKLQGNLLNMGNKPLLHDGENIVEIACGSLHSIALSNKGRVFSCGFGETFSLGHGTNKNYNHFKEISFFSELFRENNQKFQIDKIECGVAHTGILVSKQLYLWGMYAIDPNTVIKRPQLISLKIDMFDILLGDMLTVMFTYQGVFTMGENTDGQLGVGQKIERQLNPMKIEIPEMEYIVGGFNHVIACNHLTNKVYAWGSNRLGQINPFSAEDCFYQPTFQEWLCNSPQFLIKSKSNMTFYFSKSQLEKPQQKIQQNPDSENEKLLLKQELDQKTEQLIELTKEKETLKNEVVNLQRQILESNDSVQNLKKSNFNTNEEINDIINQFKKELKKEKTLKPHFEIDYKELVMIKHLAEGGFGVIYKAKWRETVVAVKILKRELMKEDTIKDFLYECSAMESLRHPNIVTFMGACTKFPDLAIVLEYCSNKSLWTLLQNQKFNISWEERKKLALEIARGMNYLHCFDPPIIHRDLKSLNILIDDAFKAKIADFGWTRLKATRMTNKIGTFQWMAPEVINSENYTEKADIYSFGIILWEIAAREPPYKSLVKRYQWSKSFY